MAVSIRSKTGEVLSENAVKDLKSSIKAEIVIKGEATEEKYRASIDRFNKAFIEEAQVVVFPENETDIAAALAYVQKYNLDFCMAGGRHSYHGASSTTGLIIDLGKMRKVSVDVKNKTVTAQGGCKAVDLDEPCQAAGFSVVMGLANDTGIGGITLGGGTGPLTGQYGLVIDNLVAARLVIADGSVVTASEKENPDLFWAIRGGGPNFGVVAEFTYRIHPQPDVFHGVLVFTPDKTPEVFKLIDPLQEASEKSDGKLMITLALTKMPGMPKVHTGMIVFYDGPEAEARTWLAPVYALGPIMEETSMKPYADVTKPSLMVDGPPTHQNYSPSSVLMHSPVDLAVLDQLEQDFDAFVARYGDAIAPSRVMIEMRAYKYSAAVSPTATALIARRKAIPVVMEAMYDSAQVSHALMRTEVKGCMNKVKEAVEKSGKEGSKYGNANLADGSAKVQDMFGANYAKLREVKKKYDPGFIFNKWYPIPPAV